MSIIITLVTHYGIIHISDSNVSTLEKDLSHQEIKTTEFAGGLLSYAGVTTVGGIGMMEWLDDFKYRHSHAPIGLTELASRLKDSLDHEMSEAEKHVGSIMHLSGYERVNNIDTPLFFHIRNVESNASSNYIEPTMNFRLSEDFNSQGQPGGYSPDFPLRGMFYVNGVRECREVMFLTLNEVGEFLNKLWIDSDLFIPPNSLETLAALMKAQVQLSITLFNIAGFFQVGGPLRVAMLHNPSRRIARTVKDKD